MKLQQIISLGLVALLLSAGTALAMPANVPDNAGAGNAGHGVGHDARDTNRNEHAASAPHGKADSDHVQGPPIDLPEQVPDHVAQIHDLIRQFIDGTLEGSLGEAVSSVVGHDARGNESAPGMS